MEMWYQWETCYLDVLRTATESQTLNLLPIRCRVRYTLTDDNVLLIDVVNFETEGEV